MSGPISRTVVARLLPGCAVVLLAFIFFWPFFGGGKFFLAADTLSLSYPWRAHAPPGFRAHNILITDPVNHNWAELYNRQLKEGRLASWNPNLLLGLPATGASAMSGMSGRLYPPKLLAHRLLETATAHSLLLFLHVSLMGLGMYALLRGFGAGAAGALFGGVAWMFNGCAMVWLEFETTVAVSAYLPLLLLCLERLAAAPGLRWAPVGGLALGVFVLAGHPQYLIYALILVGAHLAWSLLRALRRRADGREVARLLLGYFAVGAVGGLIGAAELLPIAQLLRHSGRIARDFDFRSFFETLGRVPWRYYVTLVFPDWFGSPPLRFNVVPALPTQEYMNYCELTFYAGVPTLFGVLACLCAGGSGARRFLLATAAGVALLMSGTVLYLPFFHLVPGMDRMNPTRLVWLFDFALVAAAGLGVDALGGLSRRRRACFLALAAVLAASVALLAWAGRSPALVAWFNAEAFGGGVGANPRLFAAVRRLRDPASAVILKPLALTLCAAALTAWLALARGGRRSWPVHAALLALLAADLISFGRGFNTLSERGQIYPVTESIEFLQRQPGPFRVLQDVPRGLNFNTMAPFRLQEAGGYSSFYPEGTNALMSGLEYGAARTAERFDRWVALTDPKHRALDLMNVRYVLTHPDFRLPEPRYRLAHRSDLAVYESLAALPRAWVVPAALPVPDRAAALAAVAAGTFDPRGVVLLEDPAAVAGYAAGGSGAATVERYAEDRVTVAVDATAPAWLVLADVWYPGWEAAIDGASAKIERANANFRAVRVPAGRSRVEFAYRPAAVRWGYALSGIGLALALAGLLAAWPGARWPWRGPSPAGG